MIETTGKPTSLQLVSENGPAIQGDGNDVDIITVKVLGVKGRVVPTAENGIHFELTVVSDGLKSSKIIIEISK